MRCISDKPAGFLFDLSNKNQTVINSCVTFNVLFSTHNRHQDAKVDFMKFKRTIQRTKRGVLPKNPATVEDIMAAFDDEAVLESYGKTLHQNKDSRFYDGTVRTNKHSFCLFSSKKTLNS